MTLDGLPRVLDHDGHLVPVTGSWCPACSYPRHPTLGPVHPTCEDPRRQTRTDTPGEAPGPQ